MNKKQTIAIATSTSAAVTGLTLGSAVFLLADRFVRELTRPGMTIPEDAPQWGGWKFPDNTPPDPHWQRPLTFQAADGTQLQGEFWAQPQPAPTIVLSHGFRMPRVKFRSVAALEYQHGSNVLLFDYRGHGESAAIPTSGGVAEVRDLAAAVKLAAEQPETLPNTIFIHGFSMGAAIALLLPPMPEVAGIIADSPYARLDEMLYRIITWQLQADSVTWPRVLRPLSRLIPAGTATTIAGAKIIFRLRFRHRLIGQPEREWNTHGKRVVTHPPLLLIHSQGDPLIPIKHAERIAKAAKAGGADVQTYFVDSNVHCGAYGYDPATYIRWLQEFVEEHRPAQR
jgi:alpha-beta hydrolase superfamily lysophospholipase